MTAVRISVQLPGEPATSRTYRQFPVRIGRNPANELALAQGFVSEWHAVLRQQGPAVVFIDLGSTNGTHRGGARLVPHEPVPIGGSLRLEIGPMTVEVAIEATPAPVVTPRSRKATDPTPLPEPGEGAPTPWPADLSPPTLFPRTPVANPRPHDTPASRAQLSPPTLFGQPAPVEPPRPVREERARHPSPPATSGEVVVPGVIGPAPERASPSPAIVVAPRDPAPQVAARQEPAVAPRPDDAQAQRTRRLLESLCEAVVSLRRGLEQAGQDLGVRTINGRGVAQTARDGAELLRGLMDSRVDVEERRRELLALFADFSTHQIAVMAGVHDGAQALLARLDPSGYDIEKGPRFMPMLDRDNWRRYVDVFQSLHDNDQELHETLFGAEFAEAYAAAVAGRRRDGE